MRPFPGVLVTLLALLAVSGSAPAQQVLGFVGSKGSIGSVTVTGLPCTSIGTVPNTTCVVLDVSVPGLPDKLCELRISEPDPGTPIRGLLVCGTGGIGADFYGDRPGGAVLIDGLRRKGFRVVQRRWDNGWFSPGPGLRRQAARYATMIEWVKKEVYTSGVFAVTGNSGGANEISMGLTTWNLGDIADVVIPTGGPPTARLDLACVPGFNWSQECNSLPPPGIMECQVICSGVGNGNCKTMAATTSQITLFHNSVLHDSPVLHYPNTRVHIILGTRDCTIAVPQAMMFYQRITSEKVLDFVPGGAHWVCQTPEGREAIERAILGGATCTSGRATLHADAWPKLGGSLNLTVTGKPGDAYVVLIGFSTTQVSLPWGWFYLAPPSLAFTSGTLGPVTGKSVVSMPIPPNPGLVGLTLYDQALSGTCLTNLTTVQILP